MFKPGATILFQGDSITDGGRHRTEDLNHIWGHGYVHLIASRLGADYPEMGWRFLNRGISGHRVVDLYARWREDTINLAPDVLSIMVGINDVGAEIKRQAGIAAGRYEDVYRMMLDDTLAALPAIQLILVDPFVLPVEPRLERWDDYRREVDLRREVVARLAADYQAVHVRTQEVFDAACQRAPSSVWTWDGVHPMPAGHELLARAWIEAVGGA